jgi:transcriptional regulator of arginine metabolism
MNENDMNGSTKTLLTALENLLLSGSVGTQEEIKEAFECQGIKINQSRISRLLRKLGAIKKTSEYGDSVYVLPKEPAFPSAHSPLSQLVLEVSANETQVVIRTNPGSASLIAALLDQHRKALGILGTVAGDDVLFVVPESVKKTQEMWVAIKERLNK